MFEVAQVYIESCRLIVRVIHYRDDAFWFQENYTWQGREGTQQSLIITDDNEMVMDDGEVAPERDGDQYLPEGRQWGRHPAPALNELAILGVIRNIHATRLISDWPVVTDSLTAVAEDLIQQRDRDGCQALLDKFAYLEGRRFDS